MQPAEAKSLLNGWITQHAKGRDSKSVRMDAARALDLEMLRKRSRSFETFDRDLSGVLASLT